MGLPTLPHHPKFLRLCLILKAPRSHARGYLGGYSANALGWRNYQMAAIFGGLI